MKEKEVHDLEITIIEELKIVQNIAYIMAHTEARIDYDKFLHRIAKDSLNNAITLWKTVEEKHFMSDIYDRNLDRNGKVIIQQVQKHIDYYRKQLAKKYKKGDRELYEYMIKNKERHIAILNDLIE